MPTSASSSTQPEMNYSTTGEIFVLKILTETLISISSTLSRVEKEEMEGMYLEIREAH